MLPLTIERTCPMPLTREELLAQKLEAYRASMMRLLHRHGCSLDLADDVWGDTVLKLLRSPSVDASSLGWRYLATAVLRMHQNHLRRRARRERLVVFVSLEGLAIDDGDLSTDGCG